MKKCKTANWKHINSSVWQQLNAWNEPAPFFQRCLLPHELFEILLTNIEMERICVKSANYACLNGKHIFTMATEKPKAFSKILLASRYVGMPRQEMY